MAIIRAGKKSVLKQIVFIVLLVVFFVPGSCLAQNSKERKLMGFYSYSNHSYADSLYQKYFLELNEDMSFIWYKKVTTGHCSKITGHWKVSRSRLRLYADSAKTDYPEVWEYHFNDFLFPTNRIEPVDPKYLPDAGYTYKKLLGLESPDIVEQKQVMIPIDKKQLPGSYRLDYAFKGQFNCFIDINENHTFLWKKTTLRNQTIESVSGSWKIMNDTLKLLSDGIQPTSTESIFSHKMVFVSTKNWSADRGLRPLTNKNVMDTALYYTEYPQMKIESIPESEYAGLYNSYSYGAKEPYATLILNEDRTFHWQINHTLFAGSWKTENDTLKFFSIESQLDTSKRTSWEICPERMIHNGGRLFEVNRANVVFWGGAYQKDNSYIDPEERLEQLNENLKPDRLTKRKITRDEPGSFTANHDPDNYGHYSLLFYKNNTFQWRDYRIEGNCANSGYTSVIEVKGNWEIRYDTLILHKYQVTEIPESYFYRICENGDVLEKEKKAIPITDTIPKCPDALIFYKRSLFPAGKSILDTTCYITYPTYWQELWDTDRAATILFINLHAGFRSLIGELSIGKGVEYYDKGWRTLNSLAMGCEFNFNADHRLFGPKISISSSSLFYAVGASLIGYTNGNKMTICLNPHLGISFNTFADLYFGYNIPLMKNNFPDQINGFTFTLSAPLFKRD
jgi:hypothetical protein